MNARLYLDPNVSFPAKGLYAILEVIASPKEGRKYTTWDQVIQVQGFYQVYMFLKELEAHEYIILIEEEIWL